MDSNTCQCLLVVDHGAHSPVVVLQNRGQGNEAGGGGEQQGGDQASDGVLLMPAPEGGQHSGEGRTTKQKCN